MILGDVKFVVRDLPFLNEAGKAFYDEDNESELLYATDTLIVKGIFWGTTGETDHIVVELGESVTTLFPKYFDGDINLEMA